MTQYCSFHLLELAHWHCPQCEAYFCEKCSPPISVNSSTQQYCLICDHELRYLQENNPPINFLTLITRCLTTPLHPLLLLLPCINLIFMLLIGSSISLFVFSFMTFFISQHLAWICFDRSYQDQYTISLRSIFSLDKIKISFFSSIIFNVFFIVLFFISSENRPFSYLISIFLIGLLPIFYSLLFSTEHIKSTVNLTKIQDYFKIPKTHYSLLILFSIGLFIVINGTLNLLNDDISTNILWIIKLYFLNYILLCIATFAGFITFYHQKNFGIILIPRNPNIKQDNLTIIERTLALLLKSGQYHEAIALLQLATKHDDCPLFIHEKYQKILWLLEDKEHLAEHGAIFCKKLLENNRISQITSLLRTYNSLFTIYKPNDINLCLNIAKKMNDEHDYASALYLLNGLHHSHPDDITLIDCYLLAADILQHKLNQPQKALSFLQFISLRFKENIKQAEINPRIRELQDFSQ